MRDIFQAKKRNKRCLKLRILQMKEVKTDSGPDQVWKEGIQDVALTSSGNFQPKHQVKCVFFVAKIQIGGTETMNIFEIEKLWTNIQKCRAEQEDGKSNSLWRLHDKGTLVISFFFFQP